MARGILATSVFQFRWSRPFSWLVIAFVTGIAAEHGSSFLIPEIWLTITILCLLVLLLSGLIFHNHALRSPVIPVVLFCVLGVLAGRLSRPDLPAPPSLEPFFDRPETLYLGEIGSPLDFYPDKTRLTVRLTGAIDGNQTVPVEGGVLVTLRRTRHLPSGWFPGDKIALRASLKRLHNFENPGGYDYVRTQAERGIHARAYLPDDRFMVKFTASQDSFPRAVLQAARKGLELFRQRALLWIQANLPADAASFYAGMLLGYQYLLSDSWQEHLNRAGVTHLISISGLHMGLVSLLVFWIVRRLLRMLCPFLLHRVDDQRIAVWPALLAAAVYALIAGFSVPPIWRSMITLTICFAAAFWYLVPDPFSVLAASALLILLVDPNSLWQISFQLTFVCMFAIFTLYPKLKRFHLSSLHAAFARNTLPGRLTAPFEEALWLSVAVNIMVLPLTAYYFHGVSLAGFFANLVLVPLTGFLVLPLGLASLGLYAINEALALPVLKVGGFFLEIFETLLKWFSQLSWSYFWVGRVSALFLMLFSAGLALVLSSWQRRRKAIAFGLLILVGACSTFYEHILHSPDEPGKLRVTVIDVGQGSSTLLRFPMGTTMLVDGGGFFGEAFDMGRAVLAPFLWASGIHKLDYVVLSHDHPDHRNGLRFVLAHFNVGCFWESGATEGSQPGSELSAIAAKRQIPVKRLTEILDPHTVEGCEIRVIHPSTSFFERSWDGRNLNNLSLVLQIDFGTSSLILPGDIDQSVEAVLFRDWKSPKDLLLISPHHGSENSNPAFLFDYLQPRAIVFSCGYQNIFGFPSSEVLADCAKRNIPVFRTDLQGAIEATSDGHEWHIRPANRRGN